MIDRAPLLAELRTIVGARHVLSGDDDLIAATMDGRGGGGGRPIAIVRPCDGAQVSAIVRAAAVHGIRIVVRGGGTGLVGAGLAADDGRALILSLDRLNRTIAIDPVNRMATVDAGVRLSALNAAAAEHGLFFPIDLGADPMVGGMIAANAGGARLLRYGDVGANLKALDYVRSDATGSIATLGAALWKNNIGLDLKQLLVGSSGSMGIVTRATVALQRLPTVQLTALLALDDPHAAIPVLLALEDSFGTLLSAFEGIGRPALDAAFRHVPALRQPFATGTPPYAVLLEISCGRAFDAAAIEDRLAEALAPFMDGAAPAVRDVAIDHRGGLWAIRHAVPDGLRAAGTVIACDIALRRGDVMRFRDEIGQRLDRETPGLCLHDFGHIGDGGLHFNLVWPHAAGPLPAGLADRARAIIFDAAVLDYGGSFSAEHGVGPRNHGHYTRFVPAEQRRLAGAIQRLVAPAPIGRVDFGLQDAEETTDER